MTDLGYVAVSLPDPKMDDNVESNIAMQKEEDAHDGVGLSLGTSAILCEHYQCQSD